MLSQVLAVSNITLYLKELEITLLFVSFKIYVIKIKKIDFNQLTSPILADYFSCYKFSKRNATFFRVGGSINLHNRIDSHP